MIGLNAVRFIREDPCPYVVDDTEIKDYECKSIRNKNEYYIYQ